MTEQLLACLNSRSNTNGLVLASEEAVLQELRTSHDDLVATLGKLERAGLVKVLEPFPFLVLRLRKWPGSGPNAAVSAPSAYSYPKLLSQSKRLKDSYRPDSQQLLLEILETLGESDESAFTKAIEHYSPRIIRTALERVRRATSIRKNKTALFRHLLPRLAKENRSAA